MGRTRTLGVNFSKHAPRASELYARADANWRTTRSTSGFTIFLAGVSIVVAFLVESDDQSLLFLDRLQLRLMFAVLFGALGGIGSILFDLNDPYRGSFRITPAAGQLKAIRNALDDELCDDGGDEGWCYARDR